MTNALGKYFQNHPLVRTLSNGQNIRFEVTPIDSIGMSGDFAYTTSEFQTCEDAYDLLNCHRNSWDRGSEIIVPSLDSSSRVIDEEAIGSLVDFLGLNNPSMDDRAPIDEISEKCNALLQSQGVHLESGNMRLYYDQNKKEFVLKITDIGSKIMEIGLVHEPLEKILEVVKSLES